MDELELFNRLIEIRDEADNNGRWRIKRMTNQLILDRWGNAVPEKPVEEPEFDMKQFEL